MRFRETRRHGRRSEDILVQVAILPKHLLARVLDDVVHLLDDKVEHGCDLWARTSDGRDRPIVVDILVCLGDSEATVQLEEETAEIACLLAAPDECRTVDIGVFLVEFNELDFSVSSGCSLAEFLIFTRELCIIQISNSPKTAHARMLCIVSKILGDVGDIDTSISSSCLCIKSGKLWDSLNLNISKEFTIVPRSGHEGVAGRLISSEFLNDLDEWSATADGLQEVLKAP